MFSMLVWHAPFSRRPQERQLQLAQASVAELTKESNQHKRRVRELEEQIEADDRAERLEESLKNSQNRADELEFQLTKLKQVFYLPTFHICDYDIHDLPVRHIPP